MEKSFVFNSINGDRKYKAEDFREYFASFIGNGVFPNPSNNLQVISNDNMTVTIKQGKGWINGAIYINTNEYIHSIDVADGVLDRIDRVILRFDNSQRKIYSYIKKGTFSSSAIAPTLQRDADAYELALAEILIKKGSILIKQSDITDLRQNNNFCGIVHGTVEQIDVTTLFNQYSAKLEEKELEFQEDFNQWFETIKYQLSEDVAGNLANQIEANKNNIKSISKNIETSLDEMMSKIDKINSMENLSVECLNKDSEGIFKVIQWKNSNKQLVKKSTLSGGVSPTYSNRAVEYYEDNNLIKSINYKLNYDNDNVLISEVILSE